MTTVQLFALQAFAEPIITHATEWAEGVCASIDSDMAWTGSDDFASAAREVNHQREYARACTSLNVPLGATVWASGVWLEAFGARLTQLVAARLEAKAA